MPVLRLPNGQLRDEIRQSIYDSTDLLAANYPAALAGSYRFFSDVQGKTLTQTNLRSNTQLDRAQSYRILGLALDSQCVQEDAVRGLPILMERSSISLKVGEKDYYRGPSWMLAGKVDTFGYVGIGGTDPTIHRSFVRLGSTAPQGVALVGKHAVEIAELQSFEANWVTDPISAADQTLMGTLDTSTFIRIYFSLKGLLRRAVQ